MVFALVVINGVLLTQLLTSHGLWGKRFNDQDYKSALTFVGYPLVIGIATALISFAIVMASSRNLSGIGGIVTIILGSVIPIICSVVSMFGVTMIYYSAESANVTNRTSKSMTLNEAAKFLRVSESDVIDMVKNGTLRARKVNGDYRFDPDILSVIRSAQK